MPARLIIPSAVEPPARERGMAAMVVMIFLGGLLIGVLAGGA